MQKHGLNFYIEGPDFKAEISVEEMSGMVANIINFDSESMQEWFAHDACHAILNGVGKKVHMARADAERARIKRLWKKLHPPNHAGYYYCHIGGEWVHEDSAELEHITPSSVQRINTDEPGWDEKLRMACHPHNFAKGSRQDIPSTTLEYAPEDGEC